MATVVNNPPSGSVSDRTYIERTTDGDTAGWAIAIILLLVVVALGLFFWVRSTNNTLAPSAVGTPSTNINVTAPGTSNPGAPNTGSGVLQPGSGSNTSGSGAGSTGGSVSGSGSGSATY